MRRRWMLACLLAGSLLATASAAAQDSSPAKNARAQTSTATSSCQSATIGIMAPLTGPGAQVFLGTDQLHWAQLFVDRWNKGHRPKIELVWGDTHAGAAAVARRFAANKALLATIGPATAPDVRAAGPILKGAGVAMVSASALGSSLAGGSFKGVFFRVVPNAATEGPTDAAYMLKKLGVGKGDTVMIVGDGKSYSTSLGDSVAKRLQAAGVTVDRESVSASQSNFSSVVGKIGSHTKVVFLPLSPQVAQAFGQQMSSAGKSATLFGSQATVEPGTFNINGSYLSFFAPFAGALPADAGIVRTFAARYGPPGPFGSPAYVATQAVVDAIKASCSHGHTVSRALVRSYIAKTNIKGSILGVPIAFESNGDLKNGSFWIYKIVSGKYVLQTR